MSKGLIVLAALLYVPTSSADQQVVSDSSSYDSGPALNDFYYSNYDSPQSSESPTTDPVKDAFYYANYPEGQSAQTTRNDWFYYVNELDPMNSGRTTLQQAAYDLIEAIKPLPDAKKFELVKTFLDINFRYGTDKELHNIIDWWMPLTEFLRKGAGDCEDWALAMYEMLRLSGADTNKLFLEHRYMVYSLQPGREKEAHMVLVHEDEGRRTVSDNLFKGVRDDSFRKDISPPNFGFNDDSLRIGTRVVEGINPVNRLSKWRDLKKLNDHSNPDTNAGSENESYSDMER